MDDAATIFDDVDDLIENVAIAAAEAQIDAGEGVPHEVVSEWLQRLARGEQTAPDFLGD
jgi:predicted transcriptional regulator